MACLRSCFFVGALAVATLQMSAEASATGAIKLDNKTFDKLITIPGLTTLVKFDKDYAYGEKEDAFKEICKLAFPVKDFLIAEVPVQEYGDKENEDLADRYNFKSDDFPIFTIFKGSTDSPTKFEGFPNPTAVKPHDWDDDEDGEWEPSMITEITAENLVLWLRKEGIKMPSVGTIFELDEVAKRFLADGLKDSDLQAAKELAEGDHKNDKKAPIYIKIMEKVKAKGVGYVQSELTRVKKILDGKITEQKKTELEEKVKILNVFAEQ